MKRLVLAAAMVLVLADAAPAQFVTGPIRPPAFGNPFVLGNGFGFSYQRHGVRVAGFASGVFTRSVFVAPPFLPVLPPVTTLTPFGWVPGFLEPGWGVGPGWGWFAPPTVIVVPPPIILAGGNVKANDDDGNPALAFENLPRPINDDLPRGAKPGDFLVIRPKPNALPLLPPPVVAQGQILPEVERVAARPKVPAFRFDPFAKPVAINVERPDPDPVKESARLVKLGREAFAMGEYGKAAEQFQRATRANPRAALPLFLQAQAAFAAGRYADAVIAIRAGLEFDPAWPASLFDLKEPYGANAAAFAAHLAELRKTVAANPGEPTLEFLLGYQLWFIGETAEAKKWFETAEKRLDKPGPISLFQRD